MTQPIQVQWALLRHVPVHPRQITAAELTARLEAAGIKTTKRSVERHLNNLSGIFPIDANDRSRPFGWRWSKGAESMSLPGMDLQTALAFVAAEQFLEPLLPKSTMSYLEPHFRQAHSTLASEPDTFGEWSDKVRTLPRGFSLQAPDVDAEVERTVYEAILKNRTLSIEYKGRGDDAPKIYDRINPLALVYRDPLIYLVVTFWSYDDPRQLLLHRIEHAEMLETEARTPEGFDIDEYIADGEFGLKTGETFRLEAIFTSDAAAHLYETPISRDQRLTELDDGRVRVEASVPRTEELVWWLRGFGDQVEVISDIDN